jgi:glycosyltransferase involved in cell wall biosynthesis
MAFRRRKPLPLADRGPLRVMFLTTSMPLGGAETLLVNLVRRLDRQRFLPSLCCLKAPGVLGESLRHEIPLFGGLIRGKYDLAVVPRLARLFRAERIDALVTVGAGDKMFWGRIAARIAGVPVVCCALHSTGWPDAVGRLNRSRLLARWTDAFIGVAAAHGRHLHAVERFPADKVRVIPNGVDVEAFAPREAADVRAALRLRPAAPLVGIVAALRPEKNHALFLRAAAAVRRRVPEARFLVIGDGPERARLEQLSARLGLAGAVHFLGSRRDVPRLLAALDVFVLTSHIEANPVSILEAMAGGKPVVAPNVGSIGESVIDGQTGYLTAPDDEADVVRRVVELLADRPLARRMGQAGRDAVVARWSLAEMVAGYERLIGELYERKAAARGKPASARRVSPPPARSASP